MPVCQGQLSDGKPCLKSVEEGKIFCRWHDPDDESWREIYDRLKQTDVPEEKAEIVLSLIEEHPEHRLILPRRDDQVAELLSIDLSPETLVRRTKWGEPSWWEWDGSIVGGAAQLADANLEGAELSFANLKAAFLNGANLRGANLAQANLQSARLGDANLQDASLVLANLQDANLWDTNLEHADLAAANLQGAYLWGANLRNANLREANLQDANLSFAKLQGANLKMAKLQNADLSTAEDISNVYFGGAWLDRTRIRQEKLGDAIGEDVEVMVLSDYAEAKYAYIALKQNFDDLGDYDAASWAYRKERRIEKFEGWEKAEVARSKRKWRNAAAGYFKFFSDTLVEWLCDYGESVWRVIGWIAALLFIIGPFLFSVMGGLVSNEEISREYSMLSSSWDKFWFTYELYLLYTLDALTTASFSDLRPTNNAVRLASGCFAMVGIILAGLLGFVAGNRIRRS